MIQSFNERVLHWDGCKNVRDLGGLPTADDSTTRFGVLVRSDTPSRLTVQGWSTLYAYGIRTIISLHTIGMEEKELTVISPYPDVSVVRAAIEDITDLEFRQRWASSELWSTPLYYQDALQRWPERHAAVISAIARAGTGGVLFHCIRGHDRTGIITLLLLSLAGVTKDAIIADYELSIDPERDVLLERAGSSVRQAVCGALDGIDVENYLLMGGASPADLNTVRQRLMG